MAIYSNSKSLFLSGGGLELNVMFTQLRIFFLMCTTLRLTRLVCYFIASSITILNSFCNFEISFDFYSVDVLIPAFFTSLTIVFRSIHNGKEQRFLELPMDKLLSM